MSLYTVSGHRLSGTAHPVTELQQSSNKGRAAWSGPSPAPCTDPGDPARAAASQPEVTQHPVSHRPPPEILLLFFALLLHLASDGWPQFAGALSADCYSKRGHRCHGAELLRVRGVCASRRKAEAGGTRGLCPLSPSLCRGAPGLLRTALQ